MLQVDVVSCAHILALRYEAFSTLMPVMKRKQARDRARPDPCGSGGRDSEGRRADGCRLRRRHGLRIGDHVRGPGLCRRHPAAQERLCARYRAAAAQAVVRTRPPDQSNTACFPSSIRWGCPTGTRSITRHLSARKPAGFAELVTQPACRPLTRILIERGDQRVRKFRSLRLVAWPEAIVVADEAAVNTKPG